MIGKPLGFGFRFLKTSYCFFILSLIEVGDALGETGILVSSDVFCTFFGEEVLEVFDDLRFFDAEGVFFWTLVEEVADLLGDLRFIVPDDVFCTFFGEVADLLGDLRFLRDLVGEIKGLLLQGFVSLCEQFQQPPVVVYNLFTKCFLLCSSSGKQTFVDE